jgi:hypothetical protein
MVAEIIIASSRIPDQSLDAQMLRLAAQVVGVCATAAIIFHGAYQEDLNLGILRIVEEAGTGVALPTRILYRSRDSGVAVERWEKAGA